MVYLKDVCIYRLNRNKIIALYSCNWVTLATIDWNPYLNKSSAVWDRPAFY